MSRKRPPPPADREDRSPRHQGIERTHAVRPVPTMEIVEIEDEPSFVPMGARTAIRRREVSGLETCVMSDRGIGVLAPLAMAVAARLTDAQVEAVIRPGWLFCRWDYLNMDHIDGRTLTQPRLAAGAIVVGQWLERLTETEAHTVLGQAVLDRLRD